MYANFLAFSSPGAVGRPPPVHLSAHSAHAPSSDHSCTMCRILLLTTAVALLLHAASGRPAERAETPKQSPTDFIVETKEGIGFNLIQRRLIDALNPRPIVDTITEEEKYGNMMEHNIGKKVVKAVEGVSNLVNTAFTGPQEAVKTGSRKLTDFLDNIGGRLVGLQKR